jgi:hypothetical protein
VPFDWQQDEDEGQEEQLNGAKGGYVFSSPEQVAAVKAQRALLWEWLKVSAPHEPLHLIGRSNALAPVSGCWQITVQFLQQNPSRCLLVCTPQHSWGGPRPALPCGLPTLEPLPAHPLPLQDVGSHLLRDGLNLTKISMPVKLFEPRSWLERMCDNWCVALRAGWRSGRSGRGARQHLLTACSKPALRQETWPELCPLGRGSAVSHRCRAQRSHPACHA